MPEINKDKIKEYFKNLNSYYSRNRVTINESKNTLFEYDSPQHEKGVTIAESMNTEDMNYSPQHEKGVTIAESMNTEDKNYSPQFNVEDKGQLIQRARALSFSLKNRINNTQEHADSSLSNSSKGSNGISR